MLKAELQVVEQVLMITNKPNFDFFASTLGSIPLISLWSIGMMKTILI